MSETKTPKTKAKRVEFGVGAVISLLGLVLFFIGQSPISMVMIIGGLLLAILGKLQEIAWNTAPENRVDETL